LQSAAVLKAGAHWHRP